MSEPRLVTLTEEDVPELAALCASTLPFDDCSPSLLRYTLLLSTPTETTLALGLRRDSRLVSMAVGVLEVSRKQGLSGLIKLVGTAPDAQRRGYARLLIGELEARFRAQGATEARIAFGRRYFVPAVDLRYSRALCLFDRLEYTRRSLTYNLDVDLTRRSFDPSPLVRRLHDEGIGIRRLKQDDEAAFTQYLAERWSAGWQYEGLQALRVAQHPVPGHLALVGDSIVGFAVYDVTRPGWFGPIGTNAELRGKDVGTALLHACLFDWQHQGRQRGEIAGIGPLYFYVSSCDALISRAFQMYDKALT